MAVNWQSPFKRLYAGNLDADYTFETLAEMQSYLDGSTKYAGMTAYCKDTDKVYYLNNTLDSWNEIGGGSADFTISESVIVENSIGQLTKGTDLYGMDLFEVIKKMVKKVVKLWNGTTMLYGAMDDISVDTIDFTASGLNTITGTNESYLKTIHNTHSQYTVFLCPNNIDVVTVKDQNGLDYTECFLKKDINLVVSTGMIVQYTMYYSEVKTTVTDYKMYWYFEDVD